MAVILTHLKAQRIAKGFTQETLASAAGISTRTIQRIEKGEEAALETAKSISAALDCQNYHELCETTPIKNNPERNHQNDNVKLLTAIKSMRLSERLPQHEDKLIECGEANEAIEDHWIFSWRGMFLHGAVGVLMSIQIPVGVSLLISFMHNTGAVWTSAIGFTATFFLLVILPHLISTPAIRKAERLSSNLNIDATLSRKDILTLHKSMAEKITRAESGDRASMLDVALSLKKGGELLPVNKKDALVIMGAAAESGNREAAEEIMRHFIRTSQDFIAYCKYTGLDAKQAAYEAAIKAKSLGSLEAAQYIAKIETPPQRSVGIGSMLVGVALGVAILS